MHPQARNGHQIDGGCGLGGTMEEGKWVYRTGRKEADLGMFDFFVAGIASCGIFGKETATPI